MRAVCGGDIWHRWHMQMHRCSMLHVRAALSVDCQARERETPIASAYLLVVAKSALDVARDLTQLSRLC